VIGFVHLRHPFDLGGLYYCLNAVLSMLSVLASAVIYSLCVPAATFGDVLGVGINGTERKGLLANSASANSSASHTRVDHTMADATKPNLSLGKIDDFTLIVSVAALMTVWVVSAAGLLLTIKRKYVRSFVSPQTGCDLARSFFRDHEGNDAMRVRIFLFNERQWRSIRDRVREWVCNMYAVWEQLRPTWFNESLQLRIPDDLMPPQVVVQLNAHAPGGRRKTLDGMSLLRRATLTSGANALTSEVTSDSAFVISVPSPEASQPATLGNAPAISAATPLNIEVGSSKLGFVTPTDWPDNPVGDEHPMMPEEVPEDSAR
jgi:hypothetical protein